MQSILRRFDADTIRGRSLLTIQVCSFLDSLAVSFFIPLLPFYWRQLGVRPELLGVVSSVYTCCQIFSGVILGYIGDHVLGRKGVLLVSFVGSAISYSLAAISFQSGLVSGVILSRVIVGVVKQSTTISTAAIISLTTEAERVGVLSRFRASSTIAFMVGPPLGGLLSKWFDKSVPAYIASAIFILSTALVLIFLPSDSEIAHEHQHKDKTASSKKNDGATADASVCDAGDADKVDTNKAGKGKAAEKKKAGTNNVWEGAWKIVSLPGLGALTCIKLVHSAFVAADPMSSIYMTEKYKLEPHHLGYQSTASSITTLLIQMWAVSRIAKRLGEERTLHAGLLLEIVLAFVEGATSSIYLHYALMPLRILAFYLTSLMFESMFTEFVPESEAAAALGSLGFLKTIMRVLGPLYGGLAIGQMQAVFDIKGRPLLDALHKFVLLVALLACFPLRGSHKTDKTDKTDKKKTE